MDGLINCQTLTIRHWLQRVTMTRSSALSASEVLMHGSIVLLGSATCTLACHHTLYTGTAAYRPRSRLPVIYTQMS